MADRGGNHREHDTGHRAQGTGPAQSPYPFPFLLPGVPTALATLPSLQFLLAFNDPPYPPCPCAIPWPWSGPWPGPTLSSLTSPPPACGRPPCPLLNPSTFSLNPLALSSIHFRLDRCAFRIAAICATGSSTPAGAPREPTFSGSNAPGPGSRPFAPFAPLAPLAPLEPAPRREDGAEKEFTSSIIEDRFRDMSSSCAFRFSASAYLPRQEITESKARSAMSAQTTLQHPKIAAPNAGHSRLFPLRVRRAYLHRTRTPITTIPAPIRSTRTCRTRRRSSLEQIAHLRFVALQQPRKIRLLLFHVIERLFDTCLTLLGGRHRVHEARDLPRIEKTVSATQPARVRCTHPNSPDQHCPTTHDPRQPLPQPDD